MIQIYRSIFPFFLLGLLAFTQISWSLAEHGKNFKTPSQKAEVLDYMIFEINKEKRMIKNGETIDFVRGDSFTITDAVLVNSKLNIEAVDIVGFKMGESSDERQVLVHTANELSEKKWALDSKGEVFTALAKTKNTLHGQVFMRRKEPKLDYADIEVNGETRVIRENQELKVKASDKMRVARFVTNVEDSSSVRFELIPAERVVSGDKKQKVVETYNIVFSRYSFIFARIPLTVEKF